MADFMLRYARERILAEKAPAPLQFGAFPSKDKPVSATSSKGIITSRCSPETFSNRPHPPQKSRRNLSDFLP